jgi:type I restriction enzyme, S subunit
VPLILKIYEAKFDAISKRCDAVAPIMSFPRYPQYKYSGVEWLGEVPGHWDVKRIRFVAELNPSKSEVSHLDRDTVVSFLPMEAIGEDGSLSLDREKAIGELESGYTYFRNGDVSVAKITPCYENGKGALMQGLVNGVGFGTTELIVARPKPKEIIGPYLHYLFISPDFRSLGESTMYGAGGQKRVPDAFVRNFATAFPPVSEQTQIAAFLDRETAKIDDLVAQQRRLMELLKEKRQAVISHAVTQGLNPQAPMKHSGIEWLGDVPVHWEIKSIRYILDAIGDVDHFMPESVEKGVPYLMTGDLKEFVSAVSLDDCKQISHADYWELSKRIKSSKGDVIMARYATIGTSMYVDIDADFLVSYSCVTLKANQSKVSGFYLFHYMKSAAFRQGVENRINTNTQGNVGIKDLQSVKIAVAPIDEQTAIAVFLDAETAKFDTLTTVAQLAIDLLQERRTALISAAVTGQIDVRKA